MRKLWIVAAVVVVAVPGLGFAADRVVAARAAGRLADRLACAAKLSPAPEVSFGGTPFLVQAARGSFGTVRVRAPRVSSGRFTVAVDATAHDVSLPGGGGAVRAGSLTADVTVPYAVLGAAAGQDGTPAAQYGGDDSGRLTIGMQTQLLGGAQQLTVHATPTIAGGTLVVQPEEVEIPVLGLRVPADRLGDRAQPRTITLPALPAGAGYAAAKATAAGLVVTITAAGLEAGATGGGGCD
ncbi:LmeA family phospholipid-binding protein [Actinoplanes sp. RD1]|uniref:LmeA family phospholipid-binding protein n=1 Tax=Actinoplanes sp. RD1 TaxID=3064538 RepID=UPI0027413C0A|nr:DUF2993 domain-containing protein [Actinoplanes sp. RD1]